MLKYSIVLLALSGIVSLAYTTIQEQNHPPVVKIVSPANNVTIDAGTPISYQVSVADKEDGDTKYDEINVKEILLQVSYVKDKSKAQAIIAKPIAADPPGLEVIVHSNCFNCHNFNSKSIGPSFAEIDKRYPATKANADSLFSRVKKGSAGIWQGKEKMPAHPELSDADIRTSVQWIFKNALDPNTWYYNGATGIIRLPQDKKGAYIITASYTDHGLKNSNEKRLKGIDRVMISLK
jgi:cytochrome c